ncbi:MAG: hypothetical protein HW421_2539 [Ignavibacteria bacterium]|nr:hypothetical protein [Ignavibacteria bacterium]
MIKPTKTDWQRLSRKNDKEIDYSDIPKTDEKFWENAEIMIPRKKVDYTLKIDEDLALWLKEKGNSSNQAVNNIIRAYYLVNS